MKLSVVAWARAHVSGLVRLDVLGDEPLSVVGTDLARAKEELALAIADRVERTHPARQAGFFSPPGVALAPIEVAEAITLLGTDAVEQSPLVLSALVASRRGLTSVWLPELDVHGWFPKKQDAHAGARALAEAHVARLSSEERVALFGVERAWLETVVVEVEPPTLLAWEKRHATDEDDEAAEDEDDEGPRARKKGAPKAPKTPTLDARATPLHLRAQHGELSRAFGRDALVDTLERLVSAKGARAVALIGPSGVGKSALVAELACRWAAAAATRPGEAAAPKKPTLRPIFALDASHLVASEPFGPSWEQRLASVIDELVAVDGVWAIGSLVRLLDAGKHVASEHNVAAALRPALASARLAVIGECTPAEWARVELRDVAFARAFVPLRVEDPAPEVLRAIAAAAVDDALGRRVSRGSRPRELDGAVEAARQLVERYMPRASALGASLQLLRRTAARARARGQATVDRLGVARQLAAETGLPELVVRDDLPLDVDAVRAFFEARIVAQPDAVARLTDLVAVIKGGVSDPKRPLGSFLFVGPTGVGKTESAKALAAFLFGSEDRLVRLDMGEYGGPDALIRLLGHATSEGKLVEAVRRQPFSVVLLDELEKAHPAVFDVLLSVLGEARLTDEAGRTADFRNVVVVMTSNLGVESLKSAMGFDGGQGAIARERAHFIRAAEGFFRPELWNRIDHLVVFRPLARDAIEGIAGRQLTLLAAREGLRQRGLVLEASAATRAWLADEGTDPRYGARPLKRVIERRLTVPLARRLSERAGASAVVRDAIVIVDVPPDAEAPTIELRRGDVTSTAALKQALEALAERLDRLRLRLRLLRGSARYQALEDEVRVLDRLAASQRFWSQVEASTERARAVEPGRALLEAFGGLARRLDDVAALLAEAYHARDAGAPELVAEAIDAIARDASAAELELAGGGLRDADEVALSFDARIDPGAPSVGLLRRLVFAYADLADAFGWEVAAFEPVPETPVAVARPTKPKSKAKAAPKSGAAARTDAGAEPAPEVTSSARQAGTPRSIGWRKVATRRSEPSEDALDRSKALWDALDVRGPIALGFVGPHARLWLSGEAGLHVLRDDHVAERVAVQVSAPRFGGEFHRRGEPPQTFDPPRHVLRTLRERERRVLDHRLERTLSFELRLGQAYRRLMVMRIVLDMLGAEGARWLELWEGS